MGFLLHELIPVEFAAQDPDKWRGEKSGADKDIVYIPNELYSIELKTSSSKGNIFGNRSYAQPETAGKKSKSGYYLTVNFGKFAGDAAICGRNSASNASVSVIPRSRRTLVSRVSQ